MGIDKTSAGLRLFTRIFRTLVLAPGASVVLTFNGMVTFHKIAPVSHNLEISGDGGANWIAPTMTSSDGILNYSLTVAAVNGCVRLRSGAAVDVEVSYEGWELA